MLLFTSLIPEAITILPASLLTRGSIFSGIELTFQNFWYNPNHKEGETARSRAPAVATPIKLLLPLVLKNAPSSINCLTVSSGLTPMGTHCADVTIAADFTSSGGSNGTATTVARGDHNHYGQTWSGSGPKGLSLGTSADVSPLSSSCTEAPPPSRNFYFSGGYDGCPPIDLIGPRERGCWRFDVLHLVIRFDARYN